MTITSASPTREEKPAPPPRRHIPEQLKVLIVTAGVLTIVAVIAGLRAGSPVVLTQALITGILTGGIYSLVAMGLTLIYGVLHIINFANGSLVALSMYITYVCVNSLDMHPYIALVIVLPVMFILGALLQMSLLNPVMRQPIQIQLLITIGIALAIENLLLMFFGPNPLSITLPGNRGIRIFGAVVESSRIWAFVGAIILVSILALVLQRTRVGTSVRAVASNPEGARLVGISTKNIYIFTFALGAMASGAAGVLVSPFTTIEPTTGAIFNLTAFVVVVLGGMGNVPGALVGGLVVGLTEQLAGLIFPNHSPLLAVFIVFLIVLFIKPTGVFGRTS